MSAQNQTSTAALPAAGLVPFARLFPSIMLPMSMAVVDQTIVATALPAIAGALGDVERVSLVMIAYLVASTISAPVFGRLGDLMGRRRLMFLALAMVMASAVLSSLSTSVIMLSAARIGQGIGGGGLMTLSQALIGENLAPRVRARYQGYMTATMVSATGLGPVLGGFLVENFGWQAVFLIQLPLGAIALLLLLRLPRGVESGASFRFDFAGLALFSVFIASMLIMLEQLRTLESGAGLRIAVLGSAAVLAVFVLVWWERRASTPLLPLQLLRDANIWRCNVMAACHGAVMVSLITYLPIYMRVVRGASASELGLLLLPIPVGLGIGSLVTSRIVVRTGRTAIVPSLSLPVSVSVLTATALFSPYLTTAQVAVAFGLTMMFAGSVMAIVMLTVQSAAGPTMLGAASASVLFSRSLGAALGTALTGAVLFSVLAATEPEAASFFGDLLQLGPSALDTLAAARREAIEAELVHAFRMSFLSVAAFASVGMLLAWSLPMRRI